MGHNLDIAGSTAKADTLFLTLLPAVPDDPQANFVYGNFLLSSGRMDKSVPYLNKALAAKLDDAGFSLAFAYLGIHDHGKALQYLEEYKQKKPERAQEVDRMIQAIKSGNVEIMRHYFFCFSDRYAHMKLKCVYNTGKGLRSLWVQKIARRSIRQIWSHRPCLIWSNRNRQRISGHGHDCL